MKPLVFALLLLPGIVCLHPSLGWAAPEKDCADCTEAAPCPVSFGRENACTDSVWCVNDQWFSSGQAQCKAVVSKGGIAIPNPFPHKKEKQDK